MSDPPAPWAAPLPEPSQRVIDAAIDAFGERGYHATTTRDIANRLGASPAAIYVHFPSKQALLGQISVVGHRAALELVERAMLGAPDPLGRLRAVIGSFAGWHAEHHLVARVVQNELSALAEGDRREVMALRRQIDRHVGHLLAAGVEAGQMEVDSTAEVARALLSLSVDVARWYDPKGPQTPEGIGTLYADLAARMVGVRPAPTSIRKD